MIKLNELAQANNGFYIIHALPGAGKSTLIERAREMHLSYQLIDTDFFMSDKLKKMTPENRLLAMIDTFQGFYDQAHNGSNPGGIVLMTNYWGKAFTEWWHSVSKQKLLPLTIGYKDPLEMWRRVKMRQERTKIIQVTETQAFDWSKGWLKYWPLNFQKAIFLKEKEYLSDIILLQ
jgi:hypothetical protein